jgi:UDP-glucose 4-epimerase
MRALVTGGYGYIGGHLVKRLLKDGWDVTIMDTMFKRDLVGYDMTWDWGRTGDRISHLNASVCNPDAVRRAMHEVSIVYHLAARMDWNAEPKHALRLFKTNAIGTTTVLSIARAAGVDNIVFTSSAAVYGDVVEAEEYGPVHPLTTYGCSKLAAEAACIDHANLGMSVKVLRLYNVWGGAYSESVVTKMLKPGFKVWGDGYQTRDFIYIHDVVDALVDAKDWDPFLYNIGTGDEYTIIGLYRRLHGRDPDSMPYPPGYEEVRESCAAMENTHDRVSWRPRMRLVDENLKEVKQLCAL